MTLRHVLDEALKIEIIFREDYLDIGHKTEEGYEVFERLRSYRRVISVRLEKETREYDLFYPLIVDNLNANLTNVQVQFNFS